MMNFEEYIEKLNSAEESLVVINSSSRIIHLYYDKCEYEELKLNQADFSECICKLDNNYKYAEQGFYSLTARVCGSERKVSEYMGITVACFLNSSIVEGVTVSRLSNGYLSVSAK